MAIAQKELVQSLIPYLDAQPTGKADVFSVQANEEPQSIVIFEQHIAHELPPQEANEAWRRSRIGRSIFERERELAGLNKTIKALRTGKPVLETYDHSGLKELLWQRKVLRTEHKMYLQRLRNR